VKSGDAMEFNFKDIAYAVFFMLMAALCAIDVLMM
jgi:hypothetical protein